MDDIKEKIKQALRHIWINKYRLFFCLLTLCCLFGLVHYFKSGGAWHEPQQDPLQRLRDRFG